MVKIMPRVKFLEGKQSKFLEMAKKKFNLGWLDLAEICEVNKRTFFDWRKDKYQMRYNSFQALSERLKISIPKIEILPDNWNIKNAARLGALRRMELYGNFGTPDGRIKGGKMTWNKYTISPQSFKDTGFIAPKNIKYPSKSLLLSEAVGIILGDGSLTKYQLRISLNSQTEKEYAGFILKLFKELFNLKGVYKQREKSACDLVFSSVKLIKFLNGMGLKTGDKMLQQIDIPKWILGNKGYMGACLRGLIDTDGGIYYHNHVTKGIKYRHIGLCFTSYSSPLLKNIHNILIKLGFPASIRHNGRIYIYNSSVIKKYFEKIGTHNNHHYKRFRDYFSSGEVA